MSKPSIYSLVDCRKSDYSFSSLSGFFIPIFYGLIASGIILAFYQFGLNRSLWIDEAALAVNILNRGYRGLTEPLMLNQVAPIGFLFIEKAMIQIIGPNEYALRLFPLLAYGGSVYLCYLTSLKLFQNRYLSFLISALFALSVSALEYSSEVKQYSSDTFFALLILYLSIALNLRKWRSILMYLIISIISVWTSNPSIIILFVCGLYLLRYEIVEYRNYRLFFAFSITGLSFIVYYLVFAHEHPTSEFMRNFWHGAFMPLNPFSHEFIVFILSAAESIFGFLFGFGPFWFFSFSIFLVGVLHLFQTGQYKVLYFLLAPLLLHIILSGFQLYPFHGRFLLYQLPLLLTLYATGLLYLFIVANKLWKGFTRYLIIAPAFLLFYPISIKFPFYKEELKPALTFIQDRQSPSDKLYVYHGAQPAFAFYCANQTFKTSAEVILGSDCRANYCDCASEFLKLEGRVWFLLSHLTKSYEDSLIAEINDNHRLLHNLNMQGASVYLFEVGKNNFIQEMPELGSYQRDRMIMIAHFLKQESDDFKEDHNLFLKNNEKLIHHSSLLQRGKNAPALH